jgi:hypothetical protein
MKKRGRGGDNQKKEGARISKQRPTTHGRAVKGGCLLEGVAANVADPRLAHLQVKGVRVTAAGDGASHGRPRPRAHGLRWTGNGDSMKKMKKNERKKNEMR